MTGTDRRSISLVLGSGGARGLSHIGVIRQLQREGFEIRAIAGSSMGALIGGMFAIGKLDVYAEWVSALERVDVLRLLDLSFSSGALFKGDRIVETLRALVGDRAIESLSIAYTAVAVDIDRGREVWLDRGSLFQAIRASIAVPTLFRPVPVNGRRLVDGGLLNPLPLAATLRDQTDLTIAVHVTAPGVPTRAPPATVALNDQADPRLQGRIREFVRDMQMRFRAAPGNDLDLLAALSRSLEIMEDAIGRWNLSAHAPDLLISIPRRSCGFHEFHRAREMIALGENITAATLERHRSEGVD